MTTFAILPRWWITAAALTISAILLSPFYWVLVGSFMTPAELFGGGSVVRLRARKRRQGHEKRDGINSFAEQGRADDGRENETDDIVIEEGGETAGHGHQDFSADGGAKK